MRQFNSTIRVKRKNCLRCGKLEFIFSRGRCRSCANIEDTLAKDAEREIEKPHTDLDNIIHKLDRAFSKYIRLKYADKDGIVQCFTCYYKAHWSLLQCGHFMSRKNMFLRWDERGSRPQCNDCNCIKHGNIGVYRINLNAENDGLADILEEESRIVHKWSKPELHAMLNDYSKRIKLLKK